MTTSGLLPSGLFRGTLLGLAGFSALSAIGGAIGLLTPGSMGVPLSVIEGSVFSDFVGPALLLGLVIGGTQVLAFVTLWRRHRSALLWSAFAGFAMVIFIFVELAIMRGFSVLHGIYFTSGLAQVAVVLALLGILPGLVRASPAIPS